MRTFAPCLGITRSFPFFSRSIMLFWAGNTYLNRYDLHIKLWLTQMPTYASIYQSHVEQPAASGGAKIWNKVEVQA